MINNLIKLGFNEREAKIYLAIAKFGQARVVDIFKITKIHRNTIEKIVIQMVKNKYLTKINKKNFVYYDITDPQILVNNIENKIKKSKKIITQINQKYKPENDEIKVEIFKGINGLVKYNKKIIEYSEANSNIYYFFNKEHHLMPLSKAMYSPTEYEQARIKKNINRYVIFGENLLYKKLVKKYPLYFTKTKTKLTNNQDSLISFFLFEDHVAFEMMFDKSFVLCIKSKKMYRIYKEIFDNVWKKSSTPK